MTARPEFGAAIAVDGKRPAWLPQATYFRWYSSSMNDDWWSDRWPGGVRDVDKWDNITAIRLEVPRYDFVYLALERGMTPWFGGDEAPGDWDNQVRPNTIWRSGTEAYHYMPEWSHENDACDIVGYVPLATSTALPLAHPAAPQGEEDRLRDTYAVALIAEEAAETTQMVGKWLRFGPDHARRDGLTARKGLSIEAGDLLAALDYAIAAGVLDPLAMAEQRAKKFARLTDPASVDDEGRRLAPALAPAAIGSGREGAATNSPDAYEQRAAAPHLFRGTPA